MDHSEDQRLHMPQAMEVSKELFKSNPLRKQRRELSKKEDSKW